MNFHSDECFREVKGNTKEITSKNGPNSGTNQKDAS